MVFWSVIIFVVFVVSIFGAKIFWQEDIANPAVINKIASVIFLIFEFN